MQGHRTAEPRRGTPLGGHGEAMDGTAEAIGGSALAEERHGALRLAQE